MVATRLKVELIRRGMSVTEFAERIGIARNNMSAGVSGRHRLSPVRRAQVCAEFGLKEDFLFDERGIARLAEDVSVA